MATQLWITWKYILWEMLASVVDNNSFILVVEISYILGVQMRTIENMLVVLIGSSYVRWMATQMWVTRKCVYGKCWPTPCDWSRINFLTRWTWHQHPFYHCRRDKGIFLVAHARDAKLYTWVALISNIYVSGPWLHNCELHESMYGKCWPVSAFVVKIKLISPLSCTSANYIKTYVGGDS